MSGGSARGWHDADSRADGRIRIVCEAGHHEYTRVPTGRLIRCGQCAAIGDTTWILVLRYRTPKPDLSTEGPADA